MSGVVRQLLPTAPAHVAGSSTPHWCCARVATRHAHSEIAAVWHVATVRRHNLTSHREKKM